QQTRGMRQARRPWRVGARAASPGRARRRGPRLGALLATTCICVLAQQAATAAVVGGGGSSTTDCLTVFDAPANVPPRRPKNVRCTDGDPCDADGAVNGHCQFAVAVCANS